MGSRCVRAVDTAIRLRPELVYPRRARADCLERMGEEAAAAAARAAADSAAAANRGCAPCVDPFRY